MERPKLKRPRPSLNSEGLNSLKNPGFTPLPHHYQQVEELASSALTQEEIAKLIINPATGCPICLNTLRKYFLRQLEVGSLRVSAKVAKALNNKAMNGDLGSIVWYEKTRRGFKDGVAVDHSGSVGDTRVVVILPDNGRDAAEAPMIEHQPLQPSHAVLIPFLEASEDE